MSLPSPPSSPSPSLSYPAQQQQEFNSSRTPTSSRAYPSPGHPDQQLLQAQIQQLLWPPHSPGASSYTTAHSTNFSSSHLSSQQQLLQASPGGASTASAKVASRTVQASSSNSNSGRLKYKGLASKNKSQRSRGRAAEEAVAAAQDFSLLMALKRLLGKHACTRGNMVESTSPSR
jgi:hypothetical protein